MVDYTGGNPYTPWDNPNEYRRYEEDKTKNWTPGFTPRETQSGGGFFGNEVAKPRPSKGLGGTKSEGSGSGLLGLLMLAGIGWLVFGAHPDTTKPSIPPAIERANHASPINQGLYAVVNTERLNLRQCPSPDPERCPTIAVMPFGARAVVVNQLSNGWLELRVANNSQMIVYHGYANGTMMKVYNIQ